MTNHTPGTPSVWEITAALIEALERAEFLMRRVSQGDHQALSNLPSAVKHARQVIATAKQQTAANARLNAAAPALLAACRMVVERWERGDLAEAARACTVAIAKAA